VRLLDDAITFPLAIGPARPRTLGRQVAFPAGSLLMLYSDGLVERRRELLDTGIGRLVDSVRAHWNQPLDMLADRVLADVLRDRRREDDIALLAMRSPVSNRDVFLMKIRAAPEALGRVRERLRAWLEALKLSPDDQLAVLVAAGEACTNAIEHAYGDVGGNLFRVEATRDNQDIVCCITDTGGWKDNAARNARGNGLTIMRELMDDVIVERRPSGTSVTLRYRPGVRDPSAVTS